MPAIVSRRSQGDDGRYVGQRVSLQQNAFDFCSLKADSGIDPCRLHVICIEEVVRQGHREHVGTVDARCHG